VLGTLQVGVFKSQQKRSYAQVTFIKFTSKKDKAAATSKEEQ
jgi:hypothetical protein